MRVEGMVHNAGILSSKTREMKQECECDVNDGVQRPKPKIKDENERSKSDDNRRCCNYSGPRAAVLYL